MPTDYKSHAHRKQKKPLPGFAWLLAGLSIGLFVAFLVYLDKQPATEVSFTEAVKSELEKIKTSQQQKKSATTEDKQEPKFNFYTILPELEVLIPEDEIRPPENNKSGATSGSSQYILQAGSFKNRNDAEKLKANIALLGLEANIIEVSLNRERWHRVRIGPMNSMRELDRNQNLLHRNNINTMAMELK